MKRFFRLLGQLLVALMNATLLLALALVVVVFLVLGRLQHIGEGAQKAVQNTLRPQIAQLDTLKTQLGQIEDAFARCEPGEQVRQEIEGLRLQLTALNETIRVHRSVNPAALAQDFLVELMALVQERLGPLQERILPLQDRLVPPIPALNTQP